jgi:hypothetical protein
MALVLAPIFEGSEPIFLMVPRMGIPLIMGSILLALALNIVVLFLVSSTNALVLTLAGAHPVALIDQTHTHTKKNTPVTSPPPAF